MAIDTEEKRRSAAGVPFAPLFGLTPNASKDAEWRQQVAWSYSGISLAPVPVTPDERKIAVKAESRTTSIVAESRTVKVATETRTVTITANQWEEAA